jgi:hypothetical protein
VCVFSEALTLRVIFALRIRLKGSNLERIQPFWEFPRRQCLTRGAAAAMVLARPAPIVQVQMGSEIRLAERPEKQKRPLISQRPFGKTLNCRSLRLDTICQNPPEPLGQSP